VATDCAIAMALVIRGQLVDPAAPPKGWGRRGQWRHVLKTKHGRNKTGVLFAAIHAAKRPAAGEVTACLVTDL
jgi:hypothetical protein